MSSQSTMRNGESLVIRLLSVLVVAAWLVGAAVADEAPISGPVKAVDPTAQTLTIEATAKGKARQVVVHLKPGAKVVRYTRGPDPGMSGFVEQAVALGDVKPGWIVSVATRHEGDKEVADLVKIVLER
jgi:Na+-transporting methylmalonyl-CoA/oxaloacetate decarboxylase gamma subunit